tara:strand:+ start:121 stop:1464 length:1344 start_codon:yes stop_codon:yes gene_type:complete
MAVLKSNNLVGKEFSQFEELAKQGKITYGNVRLIPQLKTKDELALTSIFLSSLRLVKEFQGKIFKEIKVSRAGKAYFFKEMCFKDIDKESRIDGVIITVVSKKIKEIIFLEVKNGTNKIEKTQIEKYIDVAKKIGSKTLFTISNKFVEKSSDFPIIIDGNKKRNFNLFHFSWTYLETLAQLLLFENDENIEDEDQIEIMKEVLIFLTDPKSGTNGYNQMNDGWRDLHKAVKANDRGEIEKNLASALLSWNEEEKDMALLLSRNLGVLVKAKSSKNSEKSLEKTKKVTSVLEIKDAASDIDILCDFTRETVKMEVDIKPPSDNKNKANITWIKDQVELCKKRNTDLFSSFEYEIWIDSDIKFYKDSIRTQFTNIESLYENEVVKQKKEIVGFKVILIRDFKNNFGSKKMFVEGIEKMLLNYYEGIVQHLKNAPKKAPKIKQEPITTQQ